MAVLHGIQTRFYAHSKVQKSSYRTDIIVCHLCLEANALTAYSHSSKSEKTTPDHVKNCCYHERWMVMRREKNSSSKTLFAFVGLTEYTMLMVNQCQLTCHIWLINVLPRLRHRPSITYLCSPLSGCLMDFISYYLNCIQKSCGWSFARTKSRVLVQIAFGSLRNSNRKMLSWSTHTSWPCHAFDLENLTFIEYWLSSCGM